MDESQFWTKVQPAEADDCWIWLGSRAGKYGRFWSREAGRSYAAHRFAYEQLVASIPEGLDLDHLCRNPPCVNPWHLEPVTRQVNLLRGDTIPAHRAQQTHCVNNHPFDEQNTRRNRNGARACRRCGADAQAISRETRRAKFRAGELDLMHGTNSAYNDGCRCDECVTFRRSYYAALGPRQSRISANTR